MPILDRYWWLRWLAALYVVAVAAEFMRWATTSRDPHVTSGGFTFFLWLGLASAVGLVLWFAAGGFRARERKMQRLRAIRGDQDAIPLARMATDIARRWLIAVLNARAKTLGEPLAEGSARGADTSDMVSTLRWRWSTLWRDASGDVYPHWRAIGLLALPIMLCGLCTLMSGGILAFLATILDFAGFFAGQLPMVFVWPIYAFVYVFVVWRPNPQSVFLVPFRRSPFGITVDEEGIEEHSRFGKRHMVHWEDARLLEVCLVKEESVEIGYQCILYSQWDAVQWFDDFFSPQEYLVPDGMRRDEMEVLSRQVFYLIVARTGLLPHTFDRKLKATP